MGVDFQPHHIAHGHGLARCLSITNLAFHEADLLDLQCDPVQQRALLGAEPFHHVVSHGVATRVVEPVQQAPLAVASASLGPEGLCSCSYGSYNTYPGWLSRSEHIAMVEIFPIDFHSLLVKFIGSSPPFQVSEGFLKATFRASRISHDDL